MKSDIFHYEDIFQFSDETYFIHKSPFSAFLKKPTKPPPNKKSLHKPLLMSQQEMLCDFWTNYPCAVFFRVQILKKDLKISSETEVLALW